MAKRSNSVPTDPEIEAKISYELEPFAGDEPSSPLQATGTDTFLDELVEFTENSHYSEESTARSKPDQPMQRRTKKTPPKS